MKLTGLPGDIIAFAVMITAYVIVLLGLWNIINWIIDVILQRFFSTLRFWKILIEYSVHRKEFKKWRDEQKKKRSNEFFEP